MALSKSTGVTVNNCVNGTCGMNESCCLRGLVLDWSAGIYETSQNGRYSGRELVDCVMRNG